MKRLKDVVVFFSMLAGLTAAQLSVGNLTVAPGQVANLSVALTSAGAQVVLPQFDLSYDRTALTVAIAVGSAATAAGKALSLNDLGNAQRVILSGGLGVIADGAVANLTITVAANATPGSRVLTLSNVVASDVTAHAVPLSITNGAVTVTNALRFVPITPCRVADTRKTTGSFGGPSIAGGSSRDFIIPNSACAIPSTAQAYSLNVAVVPPGALGFLTLWPAGQTQPVASTLNSLDGRTKSNAAIVPAGTAGAVSVFASNTTDVILDINGYFVPASNAAALSFYSITPCRIADTRKPTGSLAGPSLVGGQSRTFPILSSACGLPVTAQAYSLNFAAVPQGALGFVTAFPTGQTRPVAANLNALTGTVTANAVIVPAGTNGSVDVFASNTTDLVIDVNGYFAPAGTGGLSLYGVTPCRVLDTRKPVGSPAISSLDLSVTASACGIPGTAKAYVFSVTVVPPAALGFLTLWPQGQTRPVVATLNAVDGAITSNMAIVPTTNGSISIFGSNLTHVVMDISGYFGQ